MSDQPKPEVVRARRKRSFLKGAAVHFASKSVPEGEIKTRLQKLAKHFDSAAAKWDAMKAAVVGRGRPA